MDNKFVISNKCDTLSKEDILLSQCCTYANMNHAMFRIWHRYDYYFIVMTIEQIELLVNEYNNGTIVNFPGYKGNEEFFDAIIESAKQYRVKRLMQNRRALTYEDFKFSKYCVYQDLQYLEFKYVVDFPFIITSEFLRGLINECAEHDWNLDETELYLKQPTKSRNLIKKIFELVRKEYG